MSCGIRYSWVVTWQAFIIKRALCLLSRVGHCRGNKMTLLSAFYWVYAISCVLLRCWKCLHVCSHFCCCTYMHIYKSARVCMYIFGLVADWHLELYLITTSTETLIRLVSQFSFPVSWYLLIVSLLVCLAKRYFTQELLAVCSFPALTEGLHVRYMKTSLSILIVPPIYMG